MDIRLSNCRISFAQGLWNASSAVEGGVPKYNCDFIVEPDTRVEKKDASGKWVATTLKQAEIDVTVEAFKGDKAKAKDWFEDLSRNQRSIRDGNKNKDRAGEIRMGYSDRQYVHATSKTRMPVYHADLRPATDEADSPVYSGCRVNARISLYANIKPAQKGVFASLQGTQFLRDDDAFGGGRAAGADDFEAAEGSAAEDFA